LLHPRATLRNTLLSLVVLGAGACGGGGDSTAPESPERVTVSPATATLASGATQALTATTIGSKGSTLGGRTYTWTSSNPAVATVDGSGVVTGARITTAAPGTATITASTGGISGSATITVSPVAVASLRVSQTASTVRPGQTNQLTVIASDATGTVIPDRAATWTSSDTAVATVSATGLITAKAFAGLGDRTATIAAAIDGRSATHTLTVAAWPVARVTVTPGTASRQPRQTVQLTAAAVDSLGGALTGRTITWTSSDTTVARVSTTGLVTMVLYTGGDTRTATITAASEGRSGTTVLTATPIPVASLTVAPTSVLVRPGQTQQLVASPRDSLGTALTERTLTWTSAAPAIATVSATGLVTGVAQGSTTITGTADGRTVAVPVLIAPVSGPFVASVSPASAAPGTTLTVVGLGLNPSTANNRVTIGGAAATVLTATAEQLTVRMPCALSGATTLTVAVTGGTSTPVPIAITTARHTLAAGQSVIFGTASESACNELAPTGGAARYLLTVFSAAGTTAGSVDVDVSGNPATSGTTALRIAAPAARLAGPLNMTASAESEHDREHLRHMDRERASYRRLMASGAHRSAMRTTRARLVDPPVVGEKRTIFFNYNTCNDSTQTMRVRAVYVGDKAVVWEDTTNAFQSAGSLSMANYYRRLGVIFDRDQYSSIKKYFGDPLLRDPLTDNDGKLHMIFTRRVNGTGAAAYVAFCDQFPRGPGRQGSNFGEYFYSSVPITATSNLNSTDSQDGWFYFIARTVIHEVKHIASVAARVQNESPNFDQSWLEEGTARHSEELWARDSLHRVAWKANTGWGTASSNGVFCDFNPSNASCITADTLRRPAYGMRRQFNEIRPKLLDPWNWSPFGDGSGQSGSVFYQTVWSLVRYTIDRYASSEASFFQALTNTTLEGTANLAAVSGVPFERLIGGWGLALYADDYPDMPGGNRDIDFPTWNLRSIYAGLNADPVWRATYPNAFPMQPVALPFGTFSTTRLGIRGGAHAYYELNGPHTAAQLLNIRNAVGGGVIPADARVAIVRLQ
ncbi:MAG TPA: Ig-like domain-containing protein, partial [Gemmatimonas sp.]|uniref:Ig-like domain-containing protein n=1 Tax=Gemmatimonas sp. TaxID=1962908 RepID=UPI002ED7B637